MRRQLRTDVELAAATGANGAVLDTPVTRREPDLNADGGGAASLLGTVTVGVMAHNEELTVAQCLEALLTERDRGQGVAKVVVVVSGSTDGTAEVVRGIAGRDGRVELVVEATRTGKANAINLFLAKCTTPLAALVSADVLLGPGSLTVLVEALRDETIGMAGGRVYPQNDRKGLANSLVHLEWTLHDAVARRAPKLGEVVVFRRLFSRLDSWSLTDEVSIEALLVGTGYQLAYVPEAKVLNHGPTKLSDYIRHRTRVHLGHKLQQRSDGYTPSTLRNAVVLRAASDIVGHRVRLAPILAVAAATEVVVRTKARRQLWLRLRRGDTEAGTWAPIASAKQPLLPLEEPPLAPVAVE